jgi:hypothetical protein
MKALDFTTYFVPSVTQDQVIALRGQGYSHAIIGFDSAPASAEVMHTFVDNGFSWDAYRVVYSDREPEPDIDDLVKGIHGAARSLADLPGFVFLDIEKRPDFPSLEYVTRAMDRLEVAHDIWPSQTMVLGGMYTGKWVWDEYYGRWAEPANRGYTLWNSANTELFGGWTADKLMGYQYEYNVSQAGLLIDSSLLRDRSVLLLNQGLT